jgi:hypothetical protein
MRYLRICRVTVAVAALLIVLRAGRAVEPKAPAGADAGDPGFETIFDGKTLDGWKAPDMSFWRVEDGAITGEVTKDHKPKENVFIVWQGGAVWDFELHFRFRIFGAAANSGMQFRSEVKERGLVHGYQADMSGDGRLVGNLYDEYGPRHALADRGQRVRFDAEGHKSTEQFGDPFAGKPPDVSQWTDYLIRAEGEHITLKVKGKTTIELFDGDAAHRTLSGLLAMPVITSEMKVQFKDLRLKRLGTQGKAPPAGEKGLRQQ